MKKIALFFASALASLAMVSGVHAGSLSNFYKSQGQKLPSIHERAIIAAQNGIWHYRGTAAQNIQLEKTINHHGLIGFSVVTDFKKTLSQPMSSNQSFIPVTDLLLKDASTTLSMTMLGSQVFLTLEPGGAKEEIAVCTAIDSVAKQFTGCTRGLSFFGTSTAANTSLQYAHNAGSTVVISNVHYTLNQYVDATNVNQTIDGIKTFNQFPVVSSTTALPTTGDQLANKHYVDTQLAGGFSCSSVSTTLGIQCSGAPAVFGVKVSSTQGMVIGADGSFYQSVSGTRELVNSPQGTYINTSTLVGEIATSTPTANLIPIADANGAVSSTWLSNYVARSTSTLPTTDTTYIFNGGIWTPGRPFLVNVSSTSNLQLSSDATSTTWSTNGTTKLKEIYVYNSGVIHTSFATDLTSPCSAIIYKNGVSYGTNRNTTGTFTEDLYFGAGDMVQLDVTSNGSCTINVGKFRLYFNETVTTTQATGVVTF